METISDHCWDATHCGPDRDRSLPCPVNLIPSPHWGLRKLTPTIRPGDKQRKLSVSSATDQGAFLNQTRSLMGTRCFSRKTVIPHRVKRMGHDSPARSTPTVHQDPPCPSATRPPLPSQWAACHPLTHLPSSLSQWAKQKLRRNKIKFA